MQALRYITAAALATSFTLLIVGTASATHPAKLERRVDRLEKRVNHLKRRVVSYRQQLRIERSTPTPTAPAPPPPPPPAPAPPPAASSTSFLDIAVEQVRREVAYSERALQGVAYSRDELIAQAAMSYVVGHVSAPGYGWMNEIAGIRPDPTAESVLAAGSGICGHAALTMAAIVKRFGLPVRSVQFYYDTGNHIANEVWYDGGWHYFDPTWGAIYRQGDQVLSITEARTLHPNAPLVFNETLLWRSVVVQAGSSLAGLETMTDPATRVDLDAQPF